MKFERKPMVNWYDPKQLAFTGVKTVLSSVFGNFADRRELQAALDQEIQFYDYSDKEDLWLDFISDLGDGFNPTYTLAELLARESLTLGGKSLKRGEVLVMGGMRYIRLQNLSNTRIDFGALTMLRFLKMKMILTGQMSLQSPETMTGTMD